MNIESYSWLGEGWMPPVVDGRLPTDRWGGPKGFSARLPNATCIAAFIARVAAIPLCVVAVIVSVHAVTSSEKDFDWMIGLLVGRRVV